MHIHEVWYCINNRFMDIDEKLIKDIQARNIPVCVIITKVDNLDENEVAQIKDAVGDAGKRNRINGVEVFTYSTNSDLGDEYVQKSEINSWAHHNLDDYLRESFIPSLKKSAGSNGRNDDKAQDTEIRGFSRRYCYGYIICTRATFRFGTAYGHTGKNGDGYFKLLRNR